MKSIASQHPPRLGLSCFFALAPRSRVGDGSLCGALANSEFDQIHPRTHEVPCHFQVRPAGFIFLLNSQQSPSSQLRLSDLFELFPLAFRSQTVLSYDSGFLCGLKSASLQLLEPQINSYPSYSKNIPMGTMGTSNCYSFDYFLLYYLKCLTRERLLYYHVYRKE